MGILEKIAEIEKEIARTQKNKGICNGICMGIHAGTFPAYLELLALLFVSFISSDGRSLRYTEGQASQIQNAADGAT